MTSALVSSSNAPGAPALVVDLHSVGIQVFALSNCTNITQAVMKDAPDLVILYDESPDTAFFEGTSTLNRIAPRPVIVFTTDPDAEKIALATRSGVHAYVVNGYRPNRLRSVIHLAQARFRHDQLLREELTAVNQRFAERKLVDRAKGILMGARQLREDEAYRALRSAAMHTKRRIGQVSHQIIESARYAEAINRAGQLRMLSQRLVKLYALTCAQDAIDGDVGGADIGGTKDLFAGSMAHVDENLATLGRSLSQATFGDLLNAVLTPWTRLRIALAAPPAAARLLEIDDLSEELLLQAERLTANLEIAGFAAALHVINVSGRQRMLSQRFAKEALLAHLLNEPDAAAVQSALAETAAELEDGMTYLAGLPLSNTEIARELGLAAEAWQALQLAAAQPGVMALDRIASSSETLLTHFDLLTDHLERGMQAFVGLRAGQFEAG